MKLENTYFLRTGVKINKDQEKYRLFDHLIEGVQIINPNWEYIYVNNAVAKQGKTAKNELIGYTMMEKYPGIEDSKLFSLLKRSMEKGTSHRMTNKFSFPDGSEGWFELSIQPVPEGVLIFSYDISSLKEIEIELENRLNERTQMIEQIEEQKKQLGEFCNMITHNMRAPLSNLILLNDMIQDSDSIDEKLVLFEKQKPIVSFLHETLNELVDATQVRTDYSVKRKQISIEDSTLKALHLLDGEILDTKAEVSYSFEVNDIYYAEKYLNSIISNLLSNAIKYRSPDRKPKINIRSYLENGWAYLEVKDNGLGIDMEKHGEKIFKLNKTFHNHPGAKGIGLFTTKIQVEAMGGKIEVRSKPEEGSTFKVKLCDQFKK